MRSRNYAKEVGLNNDVRPVSIAVSTGIFALVVVAALLFARQVNALKHPAAEPAHAPAAVKVSSR